jgi:hypothetical protein
MRARFFFLKHCDGRVRGKYHVPTVELTCLQCYRKFTRNFNKRNQRFCSQQCGSKHSASDPEIRSRVAEGNKKNFTSLQSRLRMRDIGRKGGFGNRCITQSGIKCDSQFERKAFELLEHFGINFEPHRALPESARLCDAFLPDHNIWIEMDGIHREKLKSLPLAEYPRWISKMEEYRSKNLKVEVFTSIQDLEKFIARLAQR